MAETIPDLMRSTTAAAVPVVRGITDDQLDNPTPCAEYDIRALLNHLFDGVVTFQARARKESTEMSPTKDYLTGDWRTAFEAEVGTLVKEWSQPGALEGTSGPMNMPQQVLAQMAIGDLAVHGWDLARATGQQHEVESATAETLLAGLMEMAPMAREAGAFGEAVEVPEDAPVFTRLLGVTGRDPSWTPDHTP
ncbi:MAG: TIGR03086 family metal-binding protein [Micromonosporaceae bacterium]